MLPLQKQHQIERQEGVSEDGWDFGGGACGEGCEGKRMNRDDFRERQRRVNDEQWLHGNDGFTPLTKLTPGQRWVIAGVVVIVVITLLLLYAASCGLRADGGCWK